MGRTIGFPTANLQINPLKFLSRDGVYGVRVNSPLIQQSNQINGVINIGIRPTVTNSQPQRSIEVHNLNWHGDLYDSEIGVEIIKFLRPEQKFENLDHLNRQIQADCEQALLKNLYISLQ